MSKNGRPVRYGGLLIGHVKKTADGRHRATDLRGTPIPDDSYTFMHPQDAANALAMPMMMPEEMLRA